MHTRTHTTRTCTCAHTATCIRCAPLLWFLFALSLISGPPECLADRTYLCVLSSDFTPTGNPQTPPPSDWSILFFAIGRSLKVKAGHPSGPSVLHLLRWRWRWHLMLLPWHHWKRHRTRRIERHWHLCRRHGCEHLLLCCECRGHRLHLHLHLVDLALSGRQLKLLRLPCKAEILPSPLLLRWRQR